jgi:hypothetical protein
MFSHVVIFWTHDNLASAAEELIAGANQYLRTVPGIVHFHVGTMSPSERTVVDKTYQVGLNVVFKDKAAQDAYQQHPQHLEFVDRVFKRLCKGVIVYDFQ